VDHTCGHRARRKNLIQHLGEDNLYIESSEERKEADSESQEKTRGRKKKKEPLFEPQAIKIPVEGSLKAGSSSHRKTLNKGSFLHEEGRDFLGGSSKGGKGRNLTLQKRTTKEGTQENASSQGKDRSSRRGKRKAIRFTGKGKTSSEKCSGKKKSEAGRKKSPRSAPGQSHHLKGGKGQSDQGELEGGHFARRVYSSPKSQN